MKNQYIVLLSVILFLTCKVSVSQIGYKIIDQEIKEKIAYDNAKKTDETKRVQIYHIYQIKISNKIEGKEKMQLIMREFSQKFKLENNTFDFDNSMWNVTSKIPIEDGWFKDELDKYYYRSSSIAVKYGLKK